jgi:hypothetical protein
VVDFFIISPRTTSDENFWDRSHFRLRIARIFMRRLKEAVVTGGEAEDATYTYTVLSALDSLLGRASLDRKLR